MMFKAVLYKKLIIETINYYYLYAILFKIIILIFSH